MLAWIRWLGPFWLQQVSEAVCIHQSRVDRMDPHSMSPVRGMYRAMLYKGSIRLCLEYSGHGVECGPLIRNPCKPGILPL